MRAPSAPATLAAEVRDAARSHGALLILSDFDGTLAPIAPSPADARLAAPLLRVLARRAFAALKPGGLVLVHDFMVGDKHEGPAFAAWYLLASMLDNPQAECLTPGFVEATLSEAGFRIERTETMLDEITQLTRARRP